MERTVFSRSAPLALHSLHLRPEAGEPVSEGLSSKIFYCHQFFVRWWAALTRIFSLARSAQCGTRWNKKSTAVSAARAGLRFKKQQERLESCGVRWERRRCVGDTETSGE